jgi:hypothetical protein
MATLILTVVAGFFALIEKFNLSWILVWLVELDNTYWVSAILFLWIARISLFIYRKVWVVRAMLRKFYRWLDAGNQNGSGPSGSNGNGGKRSYSTSATSRTSSSDGTKKPVKTRRNLGRAAGMLQRRIKGVFASVVEYGSMVSLEGEWKFVKAFEDKTSADAALVLNNKKGTLNAKIVKSSRKGIERYSIYVQIHPSLSDLIRN